MAGREAVEVVVGTISWGYPPIIFHDFNAPEGTTDHLLLVDAEIGTILRVAARLDGREFYVAEVTEIALLRVSGEHLPARATRVNRRSQKMHLA